MNETNFQPIFDYIDETKKEIMEVVATKADIQNVLDAVGAIATQSKKNEDKVILLENKTERVEHWVMQAAEKIEVPYKP